MRVCLVYDCLFPYTVGGAERWYRAVGERLAAAGHEVTFLTLRQWDRNVAAEVEGVNVRVVGPRFKLYTAGGRRRIVPPLVFGLGVLWHLLRHGRRYDVVHTASFPYFSLLAISTARLAAGYRVVTDWHEVWTHQYWQEYLGRIAGSIGWVVQRVCIRAPQHAFCFSRLHAQRLRSGGLHGDVTMLPGEYDGPMVPRPGPLDREPLVLFAGRHIPEKRVTAIPAAIAEARRHIHDLRAVIVGDGPDRIELLRLVSELRLNDVIEAPGFVSNDRLASLMVDAACLILPSRREGYGLVVIEAAACGTPSVVVADGDNAAVELLAEGRNGTIAPSASPIDLAAAIVRVVGAGRTLRESTAAWFTERAPLLSIDASLSIVVDAYANPAPLRRAA
jgi:glycosyltransferase involved in cell wall biosynthesis